MAITIDKRSPLQTFVYNPAWWVVQSTVVAQSNFKFICDIYISGQTFAGASYLRLKVSPDPTNNKGVFNPNTILERYLSYDISVASASQEQIKQASNSVMSYVLKFGEEYGPSSAVTAFPDLSVTDNHYAYNGILDHLDYMDFISTSGSIYLNAATTTKRFLTNSPKTRYVRNNENEWLGIINNEASNNSARAHYESYSSSDVLQATLVVNNTYNTLSNITDRRIIVPVGYNIDDIRSADIISGTVPFVDVAAVAYWKIWMTDTSNNLVNERFTFSIQAHCTNQNEYRLHFLNEHGAFDSFTFNRGSSFSTNIKERKKYAKSLGKFIAAHNYMYEGIDQQDVIFYTEEKDTISLNSDWINEDTCLWLEELVTSPVIYAENVTYGKSGATVTLSPVTITEPRYIRKQRITDKIFNLHINIQPTYNRYRQRG